MSARDTQRSKVYAAEEFVRTLFDRASERGNRTVEFFGTNLTLPPEARFAAVESVQRYVDDVLALGSVRATLARRRTADRQAAPRGHRRTLQT